MLDGTFVFTVGHGEVPARPGSFILVPRGTRHLMAAGPGGGRLLTLWTPGGPEGMFVELGGLPRDSITNPRGGPWPPDSIRSRSDPAPYADMPSAGWASRRSAASTRRSNARRTCRSSVRRLPTASRIVNRSSSRVCDRKASPERFTASITR